MVLLISDITDKTPTCPEYKFLWQCFGLNAKAVYWDPISYDEIKEVSIVYDEENLRVYNINVYDLLATKLNDGCLCKISWIDPEFREAYKEEENRRSKTDPYYKLGKSDEYFEDDLEKILQLVKEALDG